MRSEWSKPRTIFTSAFFGVFLYQVVAQVAIQKTLEQIVLGMLIFYYGNKIFDGIKGKAVQDDKDAGTGSS